MGQSSLQVTPSINSIFDGYVEVNGSNLMHSYKDYSWFWVPIIGPHIGAIFGVIIYVLFIEAHWPNEADEALPVTSPQRENNQNSKATNQELTNL